MPLVFSGRRQAFRSHDAAGALLHRHDPPRVAVRPDALDGGLSLSKIEHVLKIQLGKDLITYMCLFVLVTIITVLPSNTGR